MEEEEKEKPKKTKREAPDIAVTLTIFIFILLVYYNPVHIIKGFLLSKTQCFLYQLLSVA